MAESALGDGERPEEPHKKGRVVLWDRETLGSRDGMGKGGGGFQRVGRTVLPFGNVCCRRITRVIFNYFFVIFTTKNIFFIYDLKYIEKDKFIHISCQFYFPSLRI